ncbi:hypothetical protein GCM10009837_82160 [Streptomyces durmitorensis]|uniref:Transcriptional regulator n=1 Tax=Streptomyces durmitorensis TaxID=319947 RepID=A0ABY4Q5W0_9ACTN|nr:hypothetical protein [Streptomyces durmitorensis]UQT61106.1 hypothetical protein M4V62_41890 [Streptomyces durmitorensis]
MTDRKGHNERLRALLAEAEWTSAALARAVNIAGAEVGLGLSYDRTSVSHWLSGTQPRRRIPQLVAEAFSRRLGRAITPSAAGFTAPDTETAGADPGAPRDADAVHQLTALVCSDTDPLHRVSLQRSPYEVELPLAPWQPVKPSAAGPTDRTPGIRGTRTSRVGKTEVATVRGAVESFASGLDRHGGGHARSALCAYLADDVVPWLHHSANTQAGRQLRKESAHLVFVLARQYEDCGMQGLAQRYFAGAMRLANEAEDRVTWAMALRALSSQAATLNHRRIALNHGEGALASLPPEAPPAVRSFVTAQLAVVRAMTNDQSGALAALADAERATDQADSEPSPFTAYPRAALEFQRAQTLRSLGDIGGASKALTASLAHRSPDDRRGHALTCAVRVHLLLRAGHVEEAGANWLAFNRAGTGLQSARVNRAGRSLQRAFLPYRSQPTVKALLNTSGSLS